MHNFPRTALRAGGDPGGHALKRQVIIKVAPLRIIALDECELPLAPPTLDAHLAQDRIRHGVMEFDIDECMHAIFSGEACDRVRSMLEDPAREVTGNANIERAVAFTREDVDACSPAFIHPSLALGPRLRG